MARRLSDMCRARRHDRPAGSAIHRRFVDRRSEVHSPRPCFPPMALHLRRPPSLGRVPLSAVPQLRQYYEGATTSRTASLLAHWVRSQGPRQPPPSCLAVALPRNWRRRAGLDLCSAGGPIPGSASRGRIRDLPDSLTILPMPLPSSRTPVGSTPPRHTGGVDAAPAARTTRAPAFRAISRLTTGLQHLLSTLQELCYQAPARLASGWPACLYRAGVEPAGSLRKVSDHMIFLLPRAYPGATSLRSG